MKRRHLLTLATTVATATFTAAGLVPFAAAAHADTAPVLTDLQYLQTDHGFVLKATASGDVARVDITVTPSWLGNDSTTFQLTQPQPDGSYQTTSPLNLKPGYYDVSAYGYAPDGTRSYEMIDSGNGMPFREQPYFHGTNITPDQLSPTSRIVAATGRLTTYDPNRGDLGTAWAGPLTLELDSGQYSTSTSTPLGPNGTFNLSFEPDPNGQTTQTSHIQALYPDLHNPWDDTVSGPSKTMPEAPLLPTRIVLDQATASDLTAGTTATISGTVQYQDADGWHPASGISLLFDNNPGQQVNETRTDSSGRFTFIRAVPTTPTTWHVTTMSANTEYLAGAEADYAITRVDQPITLDLSGATIDAHSNLTLHQSATSNGTALPAGHQVQLQQSPDGRTGWTTIATLPATNGTHSLHVSNPHGYWRLHSPLGGGYAQATSNTVHTFRYLTNITGGTPSTTSAHRGQTLTFSGGLWEQGMGGWYRMHGWKVSLMFRPAGSTTWHTVTTAWTSSGGYYNLHATATTSGTWAIAFYTPDNNHTDAGGPGTYVHVS